MAPHHFGATVLGLHATGGGLTAAVVQGGNLLTVGSGGENWAALAAHLAPMPRRCTSIVGEAGVVETVWTLLRPQWGRARTVRPRQPLLVCRDASGLPGGHPYVRRMRADDLELHLPAAAAMLTEELGIAAIDPTRADGYRRRVAGLIDEGRAFGVIDGGRVIFKADIGAVSPHTCQIQGVWVHPDCRGRGLGASALATVFRHALDLAPTVSLYVNDFNTPARRLYRSLGMAQVATLSTVLF